jgi:hypothetical protein
MEHSVFTGKPVAAIQLFVPVEYKVENDPDA